MNPNNNITDMAILYGNKRDAVIEILKDQFGIEEVVGTLVKRGKERIFLFTGNWKAHEIHNLSKFNFIERVGVYFAKENERGELRLSIEGSQVVKNQATKNIVELNEEEMHTWMCGHELEKTTGMNGFVLIKYKNDMLGTGNASEKKITNFIPKSRRLHDKTIQE